MYSGFKQHLSINNILATEQYGFGKDRSTERAAYTLDVVGKGRQTQLC
jgi:hypothetical protein